MKEKDSYNFLSSWLPSHYYIKNDLLWIDSQLYFGSIKARCDLIGCDCKVDKGYDPPCKEITSIHIIECKRDWAAFQAYGQLLLYKEIVERYLRSRHYEAFNLDYHEGASNFLRRNARLPFGWKSTFRFASEVDLRLHLALLKTGYADDAFFKFVEGSLDTFLEGHVGFLLLNRQGNKWKAIERRWSSPIKLARKGGPKPKHWMEPFEANILFPTRLDCRRFSKEGKRNYWCSEINQIDCQAYEWHIPL